MSQEKSRRENYLCYASDPGFFQPSIASIASFKRWPSALDVKIVYLCVGFSPQQQAIAETILSNLGVESHFVQIEALRAFDNSDFNKTHVPVSALSRFYLSQVIERDDVDLIYVDGDTWFARDPNELLEYHLPKGTIAAAEDQSYFYRDEISRFGYDLRAYFAQLEIDPDDGYFNSGVFKVSAHDWQNISKTALDFLNDNLKACRYHDQSALNAVCRQNRMRLSPAWNFQTPFLKWNRDNVVTPGIYHFIGARKPWVGEIAEWKFLKQMYLDLTPSVGDHADLAFRSWDPETQAASNKQMLIRRVKENTILLPREINRVRKFRSLAQSL